MRKLMLCSRGLGLSVAVLAFAAHPPMTAAACPAFLNLANDITSAYDVKSACGPINVGPNYTVTSTGTLLLQSTTSIALSNGFEIQDGGRFQAATSPSGSFGGFAGGSGSIPDGDPSGLDLTFNVSGLTGPIKRVRVTLTMNHTWVGDLSATLTAPFDIAKLALFGRPGQKNCISCGESANFDGTYVFDDFALASLWDAIAGLSSLVSVPPDTYRTSTAAPFQDGALLSSAGGCSTYLSGAFAGLTPGQANGTWTLNVADAVFVDTGTVSAATLEIEVGPSPPNRISGFVVPGTCQPARYDFTGTGRTSYAWVSDDSGFLRWHIKGNDGSAAGQPEQTFVVGTAATDFWVPGDYDGDGIADAASWGPPAGGTGAYSFRIRRSSRPQDELLVFSLGAAGDNPTVVADYDGDRVIDPAVFTAPPGSFGDPIVLKTLLSTTGGTWGPTFTLLTTNGNFARPYPARDLTGDGIDDLAILRSDSWTSFDGATGNQVGSPFVFGSSLDPLIAPGNFVGNTFGDFTRVRVDGTDVKWQTRDGQTGAVGGEITHGAIVAGFSEFATPGDFDGDGIDDYTVWRRDNAAGNVPCTPDVVGSRFIIRQSSNDAVVDFCYGASGGAPVPGADAN